VQEIARSRSSYLEPRHSMPIFRTHSRTKLYLRRSALFVGSFLLSLLLAEGVMRALDIGPPPWPDMRGRVSRRASDAELIVELAPGGVQEIDYRDARGAPPRTVQMCVNEQGMRGPLRDLPKLPGVLRVACLGDSFTFGWGVEEGQSWPDHLQRLFEERRPGDAVEVLNFGVPAYNTTQEVRCLRQKALSYEPDLVLLTYFANDISMPRAPGEPERPGARDWIIRWTHPSQGGLTAWLRAHSRLADFSCDALYRWRNESFLGWHGELDYTDSSPGWARSKNALIEARDLLDERDVSFGVLLYPYLKRAGEHLATHDVYQEVQSFCEREGIACLDGEPVFSATDPDRLRLSAHDYHPRGEAHAMFAEAVFTWIAASGWLASEQR
jgi:hypothetical protein